MDDVIRFLAICNRVGFIRAVLWASGLCPVVFYKLFLDIVRHRDVNILIFVIPLECDTAVEFSFQIYFHCVVFLEDAQEVFAMFFPYVFNAKIVYY